MRADVNLSVREVGSETFGTRTEMKNLNSFKAIARAIEGERERQIELLEEGRAVVQETRRWDDNKESSHAMRSKEDAQDYRYFPDPDLVPVYISDEWLDSIRSRQPEFRTEKMKRYKEEYDIPEYDIDIITGSTGFSTPAGTVSDSRISASPPPRRSGSKNDAAAPSFIISSTPV